MMCGLRASCVDLRYSADKFFDEQNLFDIRILSTLGLMDEDIEALESLESVAAADGGFNETVYIKENGMQKSIDIRTLSEKGFNQPYLLEGRLPERDDEIVITENFKNETGKGLADRITLDEESEYLKSKEYIITGIVVDSMDVNSPDGAMGFRSTSSTDYVGYIASDAAEYDVYTVVYLWVEGAKELNCYTDEYEEKIGQVVDEIETEIKAQREQARYEAVYDEAMEEWLDGEQKMREEFAKADAEIADARKLLADGKQELADARSEIASGKQQLLDGQATLDAKEKQAEQEIANARNQIADGYAQIESGEAELDAAYRSLIEGEVQLESGKAELEEQQEMINSLFDSAYQILDETEAKLNADYAEQQQTVNSLNQEIAQINAKLEDDSLTEEEKNELNLQLVSKQAELAQAQLLLSASESQKAEGLKAVESGREAIREQQAELQKELDAGWQQIEEGQAELDAGWEQYYAGVTELEKAEADLEAGEKELDKQEASAKSQIAAGRSEITSGLQQLKDAESRLASGETEIAEGEAELAANLAEYEEEKAKAEQELADARLEIEDIDMTKWYVQDRFALSGCANVKSDADSIQALGDMFPILFMVVAILISLTTITRMVEEERGLIGTYKALGFSEGQIRRKYIVYAATAAVIGGLLGDICGYIILPQIIFIVFRVMYTLPIYKMQFDFLYGFGGILLFEIGILGATAFACKKALKKTPAHLMRPKAPKAGSRVLLEKITFIWKRLSFLNKVTARNLFRYKKRLLMTVFGIAGCTALLLCAFTIKNTVTELMPKQYQEVYEYDLMTVTSEEDFEELIEIFENDEEIEDYISARIESIEITNEDGKKETVQLLVVPDGEMLEGYICLKDKSEQEYILTDDDVFLTRNAMRVLGYEKGDTLTIQNLDLDEAEVTITQVVENYLGNMMYMTEEKYCELFENFEVNGTLATLSEKCEDHGAYADELSKKEGILSAISTQQMEAEFGPSFALINMVVYVILVLAAMLAFVVLFTLSNTNISERVRELATIKVLGFHNNEVHAYVNKETLILTGIGILCGMPTGWAFGRALMSSLKFSSLEFYVILYPESYLIAGAITFAFALIVNLITDKVLDKIDMVEALKSVE